MDEHDNLVSRIKQNKSEEIEKIFIQDNRPIKELVIQFKSGNKELSELTNAQYQYHLSQNSLSILEYILNNNQEELISCAKGYYDSGRDYYIFLYDVSALCWLLEKLPDEFQLLKKIQKDGNELLHNRLVSQLAYEVQKKYSSNPEYEKNFQGSNPDLYSNLIHIEVKTILSSMMNDDESINKEDPLVDLYHKFFESFKRQFEKARGQIHNDGMIFVGFWSKRINNELKEYFSDKIGNVLPEIQKNTTVIVIEGDTPLKEHYVSIPTNHVLELIKNYCDNGHNLVDPMAYMKTMIRNGFPKHIRNRDGFMMFRMG